MPPKGYRHLFVGDMTGTDVVEKEDDATVLLLLRLGPFAVLPVRTAGRGEKNGLLFLPTRFEKALGRQRQPPAFFACTPFKVDVQQIFDGGVNSGTQRGRHARFSR